MDSGLCTSCSIWQFTHPFGGNFKKSPTYYVVTWHRWNYNVWDRSGFSATELYIFCLLLCKFWAIFLFEKTLRNEFLEFSLALFFLYWCVFFCFVYIICDIFSSWSWWKKNVSSLCQQIFFKLKIEISKFFINKKVLKIEEQVAKVQ